MRSTRILAAALAILAIGAAPVRSATLNILTAFTPAGQSVTDARGRTRQTEAFSDRQKDLFGMATRFWGSVLTGFTGRGDVTFSINATMAAYDGAYGVAAFAGPTQAEWVQGTNPTTGTAKSFLRATEGEMQFDADDFGTVAGGRLSEDTFLNVAVHEIAHALGFGPLFSFNGLVDQYTNTYFGGEAVAAFNRTHGSALAGIPLAANGAHWSECWSAAATGAECGPGAGGFDDPEIMTPVLKNGIATLAPATIAAFADLGFLTVDPFSNPALPSANVATVSSVPLPAGGFLLLTGLGGVAALRRRRA